jgi:hypothetical protein
MQFGFLKLLFELKRFAKRFTMLILPTLQAIHKPMIKIEVDSWKTRNITNPALQDVKSHTKQMACRAVMYLFSQINVIYRAVSVFKTEKNSRIAWTLMIGSSCQTNCQEDRMSPSPVVNHWHLKILTLSCSISLPDIQLISYVMVFY